MAGAMCASDEGRTSTQHQCPRLTMRLLSSDPAKPRSEIVITYPCSHLNQRQQQRHRGDGGNPRTDYCHLNGLSAKTYQPLTPHRACNKNHPGTNNHMPTTPSSPSRLTPTLRELRGTSILKHSCRLRGTSENLTAQHEWTVS
ncbi:Hypothetical predicted protein [Pelobates cultripes]|uniref:Uncharacterized protein n=1 Tax=Pelobates cultripes TaxID=61616 RepID=A0AAD1ST71_PELCU|nr:Hypothetical predicted protein [Pelobates cultripes]